MIKLTGTPPRSQGPPRRSSSGQATIIILTMMMAAVGIGLFITRGIQTDLQITKVQEESARAFSAAEAGIDSALYDWQPGPATISLETGSVDVISENLGEGEVQFNFPGTVAQGDFATIWLVAHDSSGAIDESSFYQGNQVQTCWENGAALELILFYKDGDYKTERWAFDPDPVRRAVNNFTAPDTSGCADLSLRADLSLPAGTIPLFIIAKSYYTETGLGAQAVGAGAVFSSQGKLVTSTGEVESLADKVVSRRLQVLQTWDVPPLVFLEPVFSGSGLQAF
ncbi:hypothetical protein ISS42_01455 [Candidatus Shapirobacteria bacterium]|nr:hypothetical protein [Candidatus Shapirobacteria bacterium]